MCKYKKRGYIPLGVVVGLIVMLCGAAFFGNKFICNNYASAFREYDTGIEEGKGKLQNSENNLFTYRIDESDNTVIIISYQGNYSTEKIENLEVPGEINGHIVTCIDECALGWSEDVKSITLPNSIVEIRKGMVMKTPNLKEIICIGDNIKKIEEDAFIEFEGSIITKKDSKLWEYALENNIDVKEYKMQE